MAGDAGMWPASQHTPTHCSLLVWTTRSKERAGSRDECVTGMRGWAEMGMRLVFFPVHTPFSRLVHVLYWLPSFWMFTSAFTVICEPLMHKCLYWFISLLYSVFVHWTEPVACECDKDALKWHRVRRREAWCYECVCVTSKQHEGLCVLCVNACRQTSNLRLEWLHWYD